MRKIIIALCCYCFTAPALLAQSALKIKLHPVVAPQLAEPPASLEAAWKLAHRQGDPVTTVIPLQDIYVKGHNQLSALVAKIDATAPKGDEPRDVTKEADVAVAQMKNGNDEVNNSPEMQAAMKEFYIKLQGDEKFAAEFEAKSEAEQAAYIQNLLKSHNVKASGKPANNNKAAQMGKEIEDINQLASEMAAWQQSLETKYYKPLRNQDVSVHKAIDVRENAALKALPLITSGEYTGPDPMKEKAISNQYFNEHMEAATAVLEKDRQLWLQFKKEYLSGLARYDARLEAIGWGDNISNPLLKPGIANLQKALLELAGKLLECDQKMTYTAASWYGTYLDRPETKRQQKEITMAYLNVSF